MTPLESLAQQVTRWLARYESVVARPGFLVALSGGPDSTALAFTLEHLASTQRIAGPLLLGHVDHGQRPDHAAVAAHVEALALRLGLPLELAHADLPPDASEQRQRDARYAELARIARAAGIGTILTAHHADDDFETILFRLLRGTGPRGLAGIPPMRRLDDDLVVVRPLLGCRRRELADLCAHYGLPVDEDPTNRDPRFQRNRLRHGLMPELRTRLGDGLESSLAALQRNARATLELLHARGVRILRERTEWPTAWRAEVDLRGLVEADLPFLEAACALIHERLRPRAPPAAWGWCRRVAELWHQPDGRRVEGRGGTLLAERARDRLLVLDPGAAGVPPPGPLLLSQELQRFGSTEWSLHAIPRTGRDPAADPGASNRLRVRLAVAPEARLSVRTRRAGDRFQPLGAPVPLGLARFLQARHVPRFDRDRLPLVVDAADRPLWIPGVEIAAPARMQADTTAHTEVIARIG